MICSLYGARNVTVTELPLDGSSFGLLFPPFGESDYTRKLFFWNPRLDLEFVLFKATPV
jgi:hypothetical protein